MAREAHLKTHLNTCIDKTAPGMGKSPPQEPPEGPPGGLSKKYHFTLFYLPLIILLYVIKLAMLFWMMKKILVAKVLGTA